MSKGRPRPGEVWVRKADGIRTTVVHIADDGPLGVTVIHQSKRRTRTQLAAFLKKYEKETSNGTT